MFRPMWSLTVATSLFGRVLQGEQASADTACVVIATYSQRVLSDALEYSYGSREQSTVPFAPLRLIDCLTVGLPLQNSAA